MRTEFKHTEIGLIPHDWEVATLGELVNVHDGTHQTPHYVNVGVNFYSVENITNNEFSKTKFISEEEHALLTRKFKIERGDVLMTRIGSIGVCKYIDWDVRASFYVSLALLKNKDKDRLYMPFLAFASTTKEFKDSVSQNSLQFAIPLKINLGKISDITFPLPPTTTEQERIADALSKIDSFITDLDALIDKKRAIKTGTMQQLLTGKKRLNGFTGEWERVTFEDVISRFATGLNPRNNFVLNDGGFLYYVTIKDFKDGVLYFESCDRINEVAFELIQKRADLKKGDLLFSSIGRVGDAYVIKEDPKDWNINESVYNLRPNYDKITSDFLYFMIKSKDVSNKLQEAVTGSTLRSIKMSHLKQISFFIPPTIDEQNAIASILSSIDTEIEALEQKRDKYTAIKQGMMQTLLTGKIRLV